MSINEQEETQKEYDVARDELLDACILALRHVRACPEKIADAMICLSRLKTEKKDKL